MVGQTLAHYRLQEKIGAGGMGEVYRAQDTKLGREVALKVLPDLFAQDAERLGRFQREAQLLASLNHPNIAAIYGLEEFNRVHYLVLELVPGLTVAERLASGPLPLEDALDLCRQIAQALEAAHEKGIVHRDLKPGNVKVTPEGKVKVLDFGLAKAFAGDAGAVDLSKSPTITNAATREGVLLGTAAYMSPEQARGRAVDKRADIWAFGCVLYETLTGRHAFQGETVSDTIAGVLKSEPDWRALPAPLPPSIVALLHRCLQKDPTRRLHDIADARLEIEEVLAEPARAAAPPTPALAVSRPDAWRPVLPWALAGLMALGAGGAGWSLWRARPVPRSLARLTVDLPATEPLMVGGPRPAVALSPDGTRLVFVGTRAGTPQLYLRPLDQLEAKPIPGTEGGDHPFFSPDGEWVAFVSGGKLKKISLHGGTALSLCDAADPRGGAWGPDDTIIFTPSITEGLSRVSAAGGAPQSLTTPALKKGERSHRWPEVLPGGKAVLYTLDLARTFDEARIEVVSLKTGERRTLVEGGTNPRYAPTGHLLFVRAGTLLAVPFDPDRLELTGSPVPVLEGVLENSATGAAHYALSADGSLVYIPGKAQPNQRTLVWVDRKGNARPLPVPPRAYVNPRLSPEGRRVVVEIEEGNHDIWLYELARGTLTRLTFQFANHWPIWAPDGKRVTFRSERNAPSQMYWKLADGSGPDERLTTSESNEFGGSWSPDGKVLAYMGQAPATGWDIRVVELDGKTAKSRPFLQTSFSERQPAFSPDSRWLAYTSNESGRYEIYVQPFPGPGGKWQVSTDGGMEPVWARNGQELFYRNGDKMMAVAVQTRPSFTVGTAKMLFEGRYDIRPSTNYDISADGQRFLMVKGTQQESAPTQLTVVLNWFQELKRLAPAGKK